MNIRKYIESGILEIYVLGLASKEESEDVEKMAASYPEIKKEILEIGIALEKYAEKNGVNPHPAIQPLLMATIDYTERLESGEPQSFPPVLNGNSRIEDYNEWLTRKDMIAPSEYEEIYAKIIGYTPEVTSAIVWIKNMTPDEVHSDEFEKFLIIEGTCDITVGEKINHLKAGDYFAIPLHENHQVKVTSTIPCKVILQRVAA
jgi:mannose-6-phosphate isomerase-like protein (cupin superfamily)